MKWNVIHFIAPDESETREKKKHESLTNSQPSSHNTVFIDVINKLAFDVLFCKAWVQRAKRRQQSGSWNLCGSKIGGDFIKFQLHWVAETLSCICVP